MLIQHTQHTTNKSIQLLSFSPTRISKKTENYCLNIRIKRTLSMCLQMDGVAFLLHFSLRKKKRQKQKANITKEKKKKKKQET